MSSAIAEFYKDKTVFILGATGFVGKVLLEKLLHSCPGLKRVYILVREKKGVQPTRRLEVLLESPVFAGTNRTPKNLCRNLVVPLAGDASKERFGLKDDTWEQLAQEVNVIFNSAASVRFDDPVCKALAINCLSTISCLELARAAPNLDSFIQVSTVYSNCQNPLIEERVLPMKINLEQLMQLSQWVPPEKLDQICKDSLYEGRFNSYVFSKALSEHYLERNAKGLPVAIGRLSMVVSAQSEPEPGFIDVAQAAVFVGLTQALGALRTFDFKPDAAPEVIPVDTTANALIAIGFLTATKCRQESIRVYNVTGSMVTYAEGIHQFALEAKKNPTLRAIRPPVDNGVNKPSRLSYHYNRWVTEWFFILVLQTILKIFGFKEDLVGKMKFLDDARTTLQKFTLNHWTVRKENFQNIDKLMTDTDRKIFPVHVPEGDLDNMIDRTAKGWACLRKYKLKEDLADVVKARNRLTILKIREFVFHVFVHGMIIIFAYSLYLSVATIF